MPDGIEVHTDGLAAPGEHALALHVNTTPSGRTAPDYPGEVPPGGGWRITPSPAYGLAPGWEAAAALPFVRSGAGSWYAAGAKLAVKWLPLRPAEGGTGWFAGVNNEITLAAERFIEARRALEVRPILGHRGDKWLFALNPTLGMDLAGESRGVVTFYPSAKVARDIGGEAAVGFEYFTELGRLSRFAPREEQQHTLFFVVDTRRANFGIGRGLNGASDRWTLKAIFDF